MVHHRLTIVFSLLMVTTMAGCTLNDKVLLVESIHYPGKYIHLTRQLTLPQPLVKNKEDLTIERQVALYVISNEETTTQATALLNDQPNAALQVAGDSFAILNNKGVGCILLKDFDCAEAMLLQAGLGGDQRVRHNYRVALKLQEQEFFIVK